MQLTKILCLDLDGTVRRSKSGKTFIEGPDDIEIIPGMKELIWKAYKEGWYVVGISNQAGIAHGLKTSDGVIDEMNTTAALLSDGISYPIHQIYFCPYDAKGKESEYNWRSLSRKPYYGMLCLVERDLIDGFRFPDWDNSLFVGDRPEDEQCAKAAGVPFMWAHDFVLQSIT